MRMSKIKNRDVLKRIRKTWDNFGRNNPNTQIIPDKKRNKINKSIIRDCKAEGYRVKD